MDNPFNPHPGKIFNRPGGPDVAAGVKPVRSLLALSHCQPLPSASRVRHVQPLAADWAGARRVAASLPLWCRARQSLLRSACSAPYLTACVLPAGLHGRHRQRKDVPVGAAGRGGAWQCQPQSQSHASDVVATQPALLRSFGKEGAANCPAFMMRVKQKSKSIQYREFKVGECIRCFCPCISTELCVAAGAADVHDHRLQRQDDQVGAGGPRVCVLCGPRRAGCARSGRCSCQSSADAACPLSCRARGACSSIEQVLVRLEPAQLTACLSPALLAGAPHAASSGAPGAAWLTALLIQAWS